MQTECKLLNESATREMDNTPMDVVFQKKVRDSIKGCEASIHATQAVLEQLELKP